MFWTETHIIARSSISGHSSIYRLGRIGRVTTAWETVRPVQREGRYPVPLSQVITDEKLWICLGERLIHTCQSDHHLTVGPFDI